MHKNDWDFGDRTTRAERMRKEGKCDTLRVFFLVLVMGGICLAAALIGYSDYPANYVTN